jgi:outer membrane protein assembly factor BamB
MCMRRLFVAMLCVAAVHGVAQAQDWPTYRHDFQRTGVQPVTSTLSNPAKYQTLHCVWGYPPGGPGSCASQQQGVGPFYSSPIVVKGMVFAGSSNGHLYALDAGTGSLIWQYPRTGQPALNGTSAYGKYGVGSSATYASIGGQDAVIFGAPDPNPMTNGGFGSARLFALPLIPADPANPQPIWISDVVAFVICPTTGCNAVKQKGTSQQPGFQEHHERIAWSSPLVLGNSVYVGVHDTYDDPVQQGHISAVNLSNGTSQSFSYLSAGTTPCPLTVTTACYNLGGGIWNSLATDGAFLYFTTGNTRIPSCKAGNGQQGDCLPPIAIPSPNYGLSMVQFDPTSGNANPVWWFQPVPFDHDGDPDWAAGATVMMTAGCGELIASVQKDGWSYALNPSGRLQWQFPPTGLTTEAFLNAPHGNDGYRSPGAAWNDVFVVRTGGENLVNDTAMANYGNLIALNACATSEQQRVRWISLVPHNSGKPKALASPTVTDNGIVFIGTDLGHLVVLADPTVSGQAGEICSNPDYSTLASQQPTPPCPPGLKCPLPTIIIQPQPSPCIKAGYSVVPVPSVLFDQQVPDMGDIADLHKEIVPAEGGLFVSTKNGHVYMYAP